MKFPKSLQIRLTEKQFSELKLLAKREKVSMSDFARRMIADGIGITENDLKSLHGMMNTLESKTVQLFQRMELLEGKKKI